MVEGACASDARKFCGNVTRGEGRLVLCMQAYDDQLSKRCQFALYRVSRNLESVVSRVGRIADACWNDIQEKCGDANQIGQCVMEKRGSLSQSCQTVINDLQQAYQGLAALRGQTVHSANGKELGQVIEVKKHPDGKIQSIQLELDRWLGLGAKAVTITADKFEQLVDKVGLRLSGDEVKSMPDENAKAGRQVTRRLRRCALGLGPRVPIESTPKRIFIACDTDMQCRKRIQPRRRHPMETQAYKTSHPRDTGDARPAHAPLHDRVRTVGKYSNDRPSSTAAGLHFSATLR
jgi:hypothetical protein